MGSRVPSNPNKRQSQLQKAARQEAKAIADQPEEIKSQLLDVQSKRKRRA
ncbi:MAG: hypothetical protein ABI618_16840 [Nitrospirota bacterium]